MRKRCDKTNCSAFLTAWRSQCQPGPPGSPKHSWAVLPHHAGLSKAWYPHPQPCRRSLEQRHIAFPPLVPDQQPDRFDPWHAESCADRRWLGDAALLQLSADRHPQADRGQLIGLPGAALLGCEPRFGRLRWRWLVRGQAHAGPVSRRDDCRHPGTTLVSTIFFDQAQQFFRDQLGGNGGVAPMQLALQPKVEEIALR